MRRILERGYTPTLFNRGRTEPQMFQEQYADIENLVGDRWRHRLTPRRPMGRRHRRSGYTPDQVRATAELLPQDR